MHKILILGALVAALGALPVRVQASQFTVVAQVSPARVAHIDLKAIALHYADLPKGYTDPFPAHQPYPLVPSQTSAARYEDQFNANDPNAKSGASIHVLLFWYSTVAAAHAELGTNGTCGDSPQAWLPKGVGDERWGFKSTGCDAPGQIQFTVIFRRGPVVVALDVVGTIGRFNPWYAGWFARVMDKRITAELRAR